MNVKDVADVMEELAPARLAEEWDHIGLQVGDPASEVRRILVGLTPCAALLDEAVSRDAQMIITHHPFIRKPLSSLTGSTSVERIAAGLIRKNIALLAAHTNLDSAPDGVNDTLAARLGLVNARPMQTARTRLKKIVVFVPNDHVEAVSAAMCEAGAGKVGAYGECTFRAPGTGTFRPGEGTKPFIGEHGKLEQVAEIRLETILPEEALPQVVSAMTAAHPYEEVAYDIYSIENRRNEPGLGRVGELPQPMAADDFAAMVAKNLNAPLTRTAGPRTGIISRVALCGGAGADLYPDALKAGAQAHVTGDVKYHIAMDAASAGLLIIDAGHAETELPGVEALAERLYRRLEGVEVLLAEAGGTAMVGV